MTHPPLELLTSHRFPELGAAVRAASDTIVERWGALVRQEMPKTDDLTFAQLRDSMPEVLEQIAIALETERTPTVRYIAEMTAEHGTLRFHQNFNLGDVLQEYGLFRPVLFDQTRKCLSREMTVDEVNALNVSVDLSVRRAVLAFSDNQANQLQAATEAQSKYLSFLSHDLRGGLNGVFLMIEVLKRELSGEERLAETVEDLDVMRRSLLDTVGTMDRFLHAERFRKGKVQVRPAPIDLRTLLQELAAHISYQAKDKGLAVKVDLPRDAVVVSDRELLSLIFQNLLSNAVKYTAKGSIEVGGKLTADQGCLLWVKDEGPGIAPEKFNQLFAPFARGETYGQPGVGLGLAIARQATDYLHARLWAESKPGEGSTFFIQVPKELGG